MSKTEAFGKTTNALGSIVGAVGKFQATKPDGSVDVIQVLSGVADITNTIASFLPPPASIITGTFSSILNIFGAGGPSTEDVVKEEFAKQKQFINEKFEEQKKFIEGEFEELKKFIEDEMEDQRVLLSDVKKFLENTEYQEALFLAKSVQDLIKEKHAVLSGWKDITMINDWNTQNLIIAMNALDNTKDISIIRQKLESLCFDSGIMKVNQTFTKNHACTNLLSIFLDINQNRDLILMGLVNVVNRSPSQKRTSQDFIRLAKTRNEEMKKWIKDKILNPDRDYLACNLFVTNKDFWDNPTFEQKVRNYLKYLDNSIESNLNESLLSEISQLESGRCEALLQTNTEEFCQCNSSNSRSLICDHLSQCNCRPGWGGNKCTEPVTQGKRDRILLSISMCVTWESAFCGGSQILQSASI